MDVLTTLPSDLGSKGDANRLNVSVPVAAAAFQISTNFLNTVSAFSAVSLSYLVDT